MNIFNSLKAKWRRYKLKNMTSADVYDDRSEVEDRHEPIDSKYPQAHMTKLEEMFSYMVILSRMKSDRKYKMDITHITSFLERSYKSKQCYKSVMSNLHELSMFHRNNKNDTDGDYMNIIEYIMTDVNTWKYSLQKPINSCFIKRSNLHLLFIYLVGAGFYKPLNDDDRKLLNMCFKMAKNIYSIDYYGILSDAIEDFPNIFEGDEIWLDELIKEVDCHGSMDHLYQLVMIYCPQYLKGAILSKCMTRWYDSMIRKAPAYIPESYYDDLIDRFPRDWYDNKFFNKDEVRFKQIVQSLLKDQFSAKYITLLLSEHSSRLTDEEIQQCIDYYDKKTYWSEETEAPSKNIADYRNGSIKYRLHRGIWGDIIDENWCCKHLGGRAYIDANNCIVREPFDFNQYLANHNAERKKRYDEICHN